MASKAVLTRLPDGAMLHDASLLGEAPQPAWLDDSHWRAQGPVESTAGGRGGALKVATAAGAAILRPYRRGGLLARFNRDRYWWQGEALVRPFREFFLLQAMRESGLPVPEPLAARYQRSGVCYRAQLLTRTIEGTRTLAQSLIEAPSAIDWALIGRTIARFHSKGFPHPDLNAHNILLGGDACHLIDFDRGGAAAPAQAWMDANLARLRRSLDKLEASVRIAGFDAIHWPAVCAAHRGALRP